MVNRTVSWNDDRSYQQTHKGAHQVASIAARTQQTPRLRPEPVIAECHRCCALNPAVNQAFPVNWIWWLTILLASALLSLAAEVVNYYLLDMRDIQLVRGAAGRGVRG